jgi:hypothetical protein
VNVVDVGGRSVGIVCEVKVRRRKGEPRELEYQWKTRAVIPIPTFLLAF